MKHIIKQLGVHVIYFFIICFWLSLNSCQHSHFKNSEHNSAFMSLVSYQDSIVRMYTSGINEIDQAYIFYLDSVCPLILKNGDFSISGINAEGRKDLFNSLPADEVSEIFYVGDTIKYFSMDVKRRVKRYFPYHVTINTEGQFAHMLEKLSHTNPLINNYYTSMMESGTITPKCYGLILRNYNQLDFSIPDHRLIYTVTILSVNPTIKDRFVH